jgi:hypothetical protein
MKAITFTPRKNLEIALLLLIIGLMLATMASGLGIIH